MSRPFLRLIDFIFQPRDPADGVRLQRMARIQSAGYLHQLSEASFLCGKREPQALYRFHVRFTSGYRIQLRPRRLPSKSGPSQYFWRAYAQAIAEPPCGCSLWFYIYVPINICIYKGIYIKSLAGQAFSQVSLCDISIMIHIYVPISIHANCTLTLLAIACVCLHVALQ